MAEVFDNPIVQGLKGNLGRSRLQFRKGRKGKTIVALSPVFSENRTFDEGQLAQQDRFRKATQYAVGAQDNPLYVNLAKGAESSAYNMAIADWFGQPKILEINTDGWAGLEEGQPVRVLAKDDTYVASVHVTITDAQGTVFEEGQAVRAQGLWWVYTTTGEVPPLPNRHIVVTAKDLAGNSGTLIKTD